MKTYFATRNDSKETQVIIKGGGLSKFLVTKGANKITTYDWGSNSDQSLQLAYDMLYDARKDKDLNIANYCWYFFFKDFILPADKLGLMVTESSINEWLINNKLV